MVWIKLKRLVKRVFPISIRILTFKWEYSFLTQNGMFEAIERDDFESRYSNLINGLDEESVRTIDRILTRLKIAKKRNGLSPDLYNSKEREESRYLIENLENNIEKISKDCYTYRQYKLPILHFEPCVFMSFHGIPEIDTDLDSLKTKDIIDAGGFIGDSVLILAPYTERKVYTFEPVKENFHLLLKTMELNNIQNVVCEKVALGSRRGELSVQFDGSASGKCQKGGEKVPIVTLDEYVKEHQLHVGLIKTDLEGMEQDFLAGAKETITKQKPVLLLSMYHNDSDFFEMKQLLESWNVGYHFKVRRGREHSISLETMLIAEVV